jgi:glycosyltransferase involved in cell wall biosynthesis
MSFSRTFYSTLPLSRDFGWGICGRNLVIELSRHGAVKLVYDGYHPDRASNAIEDSWLRTKLATAEDLKAYAAPHENLALQPISEYGDLWSNLGGGSRNVGISFNLMVPETCIPNLKEKLNFVAAGSTWCRDLFLNLGIKAISAPQGIDRAMFHEGFAKKTLPDDRFIIYSGGKFEFRKGQDYVVKAVRHMQQKYSDVLLVAQWTNAWAYSYNTMSFSDVIEFEPAPAMPMEEWIASNNQYLSAMLQKNGLDCSRVILAPPLTQALMPGLIRESDIGIFPNRIEGGTNLMLMEYMACGKPVIATAHTGHLDVIDNDSALSLRSLTMKTLSENYPPGFNFWYEANLDEIIAHLEWAYAHREKAAEIGLRGSERMKAFTWQRMADAIIEGC